MLFPRFQCDLSIVLSFGAAVCPFPMPDFIRGVPTKRPWDGIKLGDISSLPRPPPSMRSAVVNARKAIFPIEAAAEGAELKIALGISQP